METRRVSPLKNSILTLFGVGYLPAGASLASLLAVGGWWLLSSLALLFAELLIVFAAILAWAMVALVAQGVGEDPKEVVVDEFLGMYAALLFLPVVDYRAVLILFIGFRMIDILKPPPFSWIERWKNPNSILIDDVAIGLFLGLTYTGVDRWAQFRSR